MSKILVILTGGTIGSVNEGNVISVKASKCVKVLEMYQEIYGYKDTFDVVQPFHILSENLTPADWERIKTVVDEGLKGDYNGIILTHGSDTLVYTASFLGLLYAKVNIPIMLVAANYPVEDERSNGLANFSSAVHFIKRKYLTGVFVSYRNNKDRDEIFLSTRMVESDPYFDQYQSFDGQVVGYMKDTRFVWNKNCPMSAGEIRNRASAVYEKEIDFKYEKEVLCIKTYPGMNLAHIDLTSKVGAVLIYMYHSATAPTITDARLLEFLRKCQYRGIHVYGASFKSETQALYETSEQLTKQGLIPLYNISREAAYSKLVLAYNQTQFEKKAFMKYNLFFENIVKK